MVFLSSRLFHQSSLSCHAKHCKLRSRLKVRTVGYKTFHAVFFISPHASLSHAFTRVFAAFEGEVWRSAQTWWRWAGTGVAPQLPNWLPTFFATCGTRKVKRSVILAAKSRQVRQFASAACVFEQFVQLYLSCFGKYDYVDCVLISHAMGSGVHNRTLRYLIEVYNVLNRRSQRHLVIHMEALDAIKS